MSDANRNTSEESNCVLNIPNLTADIYGEEEIEGAIIPCVFFSHVRDTVVNEKDDSIDMKDWMPINGIVPRSQLCYISAVTLELLASYEKKFGKHMNEWILKPHPSSSDLRVPVELHWRTDATVAKEIDSKMHCFRCGAKSATYLCDCGNSIIVFCSLFCKDMAQIDGSHTKTDCLGEVAQKLLEDALQQRHTIVRQIKEKQKTTNE